jgi:rhodanese-related sulfurtransferase
MPAFTEIAPVQVMRLLGTPDAPVVIDVRIPDDLAVDPRLIPTAVSIRAQEVLSLLPSLSGRRIVVTCQRGGKLSHGAAALLRTTGISAESVEGGHLAWVAAGLPLSPLAALPARPGLWVTRARPKIDRIACPWLIRRFVDPAARFLFVPASDVADVADRFSAIPFDIDGVELSHVGPLCTFDMLLDRYALRTAALDRLSLVVRGADTDRHDLSPAAAGLLAISVGLSRMFRDDLAQLEAGMGIYDALYRWARDGFDEGHDWPAGRAEGAPR